MIAVSLLGSYLYCPRKIFLERVLKIRPPPAAPLVKGSIKHEVYDLINKNEPELVTSIRRFIPFNDIFSIYRKKYYKLLSNTIVEYKPKLKELDIDPLQLFHSSWQTYLQEAKIRSSNIFKFIKKHNIYGEQLWENLTPKFLTEYKVQSETLQLKGIVDKIEINKNSYTPIELKSGTPPRTGVWPGNKIQLTAYILMLKEKFNATQGYVHYVDSNDKRIVVLNSFSEQEVIKIRDKLLNLLNSTEPPKICENKNKCTNCNLKEECFKLKLS